MKYQDERAEGGHSLGWAQDTNSPCYCCYCHPAGSEDHTGLHHTPPGVSNSPANAPAAQNPHTRGTRSSPAPAAAAARRPRPSAARPGPPARSCRARCSELPGPVTAALTSADRG